MMQTSLAPRMVAAGLLALLVSAHSLSAEQTRQAAVLLAGQPRRGAETSAFEPLIWTALKTSLEYSGLRVIRGVEIPPAGEAAGSDAELMTQARSLEADYLLSWEYASRDEMLEIELRWFDLPEGRESGYLSKQARLGLTLDAVLAKAAEEMIAAARPRIRIPLPAAVAATGAGASAQTTPAQTTPGEPPEARQLDAGTTAAPLAVPEKVPPAREAGISPVQEPAEQPVREPAQEAGISSVQEPAEQPVREPAQEAGISPVRAPAEQPARESAREPAVKPGAPPTLPAEQHAVPAGPAALPPAGRRRAMTLSFTAAPFFADGLAGDYLPSGYGLFPSLSIWYRWSFASNYLGLGIYSGLNIFRSEGPLAFSDTALLPVGLDIRFGVDSRPVGLYLHLSGGPALFSIDPNATGRLIKLTYYGQAGIGVTLPMGRAFGFILDASYTLFLEDREEPIRGLAPSVGFYIRP